MPAPTVASSVAGAGTVSVTVGAGQALVWIGGNHQGDVTGVTANGRAMGLICAANTAFNENVHIFYLADPDVGTYNVVPSFSGGSGNHGVAAVINGQKLTAQPISSATNGDDNQINQSSPSDKTLFLGGSYGEASLTMYSGIGLTEIDNYSGASYENFAAAYGSGDTGVQQLGWSQSSGQRNAVASIAIQGTDATDFLIQIDNTINPQEVASASSQTISNFVVGNHNQRLLEVRVGLRDATAGNMTLTGVTYGGVALTKKRSDLWNSATYVREEIWYLLAPAIGTANVVVTATGVCAFIVSVVTSWYGVDQVTPIEADAGSGTITTAATSVTTNITPLSNQNVIISSLFGKDDTLSINSGQAYMPTPVGLPEHVGTDYFAASFKRQAVAAATSMGYSWTASEGYAHGVAVLKPYIAPSAVATTYKTFSNPIHPGRGILNMMRFYQSPRDKTVTVTLATINITDTGSASDAISILVLVGQTDSATASDVITILNQLTINDVASAIDTISILAILSLSDAATAVDTLDILAMIAQTDTGAAVEAIQVLAFIAISDSAVAADALAILAQLAITDTATAVDAITALPSIDVTDTGSASDALAVTAFVAVSDTAQASDAINILAQVAMSDTASAVDAVSILALIAVSDAGTADDAMSVLAMIAQSDSAQASDALTILAIIAQSDTGSASDAIDILNQLSISDSAIASDALDILNQLNVSEIGVAVDEISLTNFINVTDVATMNEAIELLGLVGVVDAGSATENIAILIKRAIGSIRNVLGQRGRGTMLSQAENRTPLGQNVATNAVGNTTKNAILRQRR